MDLSRKKRNWKRLDENCIWDTVCYWPFNHSLVFLFAEQPNLISSLQFLQQRYQAQLFQCQWKLYIKFKSWNISKPISFTNWSMWTPEFPVKLEFTFWCVQMELLVLLPLPIGFQATQKLEWRICSVGSPKLLPISLIFCYHFAFFKWRFFQIT